MQSDEPVISGKTVTHPTDVMCWDDLPGGRCDMEFRPPSAMQLHCSWQRGIGDLTKVSCIVGGGFWLSYFVLLPQLTSVWNRFGLVAIVAGLMIAVVTRTLDPRQTKRAVTPLPIDGLAPSSLLAVAGLFVIYISPATNVIGVMVYSCTGLTLVGILCRQIVRHQVGWHTANPQVAIEQRDEWRDGSRDVLKAMTSRSSDLQNLAIEGINGYAVVGAGFLLHPACYLFCKSLGANTWSWWVPAMSILTLLAYDRIWVRHPQSNKAFEAAMGHWFGYQKDSPSSPLLYESPAGEAASRTVLVWVTVSVLVIGMATTISNFDFFSHVGDPFGPQERAIVSLLDTAVAALCVPWMLWIGLRIVTSPALVAAWAIHELGHQTEASQSSTGASA